MTQVLPRCFHVRHFHKHTLCSKQKACFFSVNDENIKQFIKLCFFYPDQLFGIGSLFKAQVSSLLSQRISFFAYPYGIFPQLRSKAFLYEHYGFKSFHICSAEQMLKSPANTLSGYAEGLMDPFAVGTLENHMAGLTRSQLYLELFRIHQFLQLFQEYLVLLGHQISSPR